MYEIFESLLKKYNVTTYQVAKTTGISTASFTGWKQGKWNFKQDKLQKIADFFGVSIEYLLTGKDDSVSSNTQYNFNDETAKIAQEIFESQEMRMLFDVAKSSQADRLMAYARFLNEEEKKQKR